MKRARTLFFSGLAIALVPTLARYYLLWPLPGSQNLESIRWAYALGHVVVPAQILGTAVAVAGWIAVVRRARHWKSTAWTAATVLVSLGLYGFTVVNSAPAIFQPNLEPRFATGTSEALPPETLVLGIRSGEAAKAYPIRLLAYHHQVADELGGEPIWVTYCTMCRTGKIFRPLVDGRPASFDLVGAVRFNSIYRDSLTGSYWYQANGRAVAGPAAGTVLQELRTDQMTLARWLELYPESEVLQPDPESADGYRLFEFDTFDEVRSDPENPAGWQWVIGVRHGDAARGWAWSMLAGERLIQDRVGELPVAVHLLADGFSHRVWNRRFDGRVLDLRLDPESDRLVDDATGSSFGFDGVAEGGELDGKRLSPVPSTVEFRHAFEYFAGAEIVERL